MRASEIFAASALVAAANAAPTWCFTYPFCGNYDSSSSVSSKAASTTVSSAAQGWPSSTSSRVASSSSSSSSIVKVSTSSSSAAAASTSSVSSSSAVKYTTSSAPLMTSSAPVVVSSTSTSAAATLTSSAPYVAPTAVVSDRNYIFQQCVTEPFQNGFVNTRALQGGAFTDPAMTVDLCANYCSDSNFTLFGVEYADECYCGNSIANGASQAQLTDCNSACAGDATEQCGGAGVFNLYQISGGAAINLPASTTYSATATATATSVDAGAGEGSGSGSATATATSTAAATVVPAAGGFVYNTCAVDGAGNGGDGRGLTEASTSSVDGMTVELCAAYCSDFAYFGVEYGRECYCGNTVNAGTVQDTTDGCNMPCVGNSTELCGGSWHMNLYYNAANGGSKVVLPTTYTYSTTSTVAVSTSSAAVPTTSNVAVPTTSSAVPASSTSTSSLAPKTSSTSSSAVATSTSSSAIKTTSSVASTTLATSTKASSTSTTVKATATPAVCAPKSTDLSICPTLTMRSWFTTTTFNNYYKGTGYTLNPVNPANLLGMLFPQVIKIDGTKSICDAAAYAMQQASGGLFSASYQAFDLHWRSDLCQWEASFQSGLFKLPSLMTQYFNVPNKNVGSTCGFSQ